MSNKNGFSNCKFYNVNGLLVNKKGNKRKDIYGKTEIKFLNVFNGFIEENNIIHEKTLKGKLTRKELKVMDYKNPNFVFYADFYLPNKKLDIEINPAFHKSYKPVFNRDKKREKLLKDKLHVKTFKITPKELNDIKRVKEIINEINKIPISKEVLTYYLRSWYHD